MKRKNKCVATKRAYATIDECLVVIKRILIQTGQLKTFYECPVCLDFHITSKGSKADRAKVRKLLRVDKAKAKAIHRQNRVKKESRVIIDKQWREFKRLFNKYCSDNQISFKKPPTILKGILPRQERLKILAEMKYRQNHTMWGKLKNWVKSMR